MVDWESQPLFKPRHTHTAGYELTPEELDLYNAVTKYVRSRRKQAKEKRNRNVELTLMVMQRRLASSIYAITRTLKNRLASLEGVLRILRDTSKTITEKKRLLGGNDTDLPHDISEYEEMDDADREAIEKKISGQVLTSDPEEVAKERDEVSDLVGMAEELKHHNEAKFGELLAVLDTSGVIRQEKEKLVIFTEHRDTLDNLKDRLTNKGYSVTTIHGGMDVDARKEAQREFRNRSKIMIATDAAGEGINLQFCRFLINWDIPWNPNRLEQRMGRIHRYGQEGAVSVYNLVASNTREGAVLQRILSKLDVMRDQMGDDRVYDVVQELLEDVPLVKLVEKSIDDDIQAWAWEHITEEELSKVNESRKAECDLRRQYLNTTFTDLILDLQTKLNELHQDELLGEEDKDERHKLEQRLQLLKERKVARMAELELMLKLNANLPEILTSALVLPAPVATVETDTEHPKTGVPVQRDDEVENFAMNVVMCYERSIAWTPYDVSKDGEHYDIRSESPAGERKYIEVKGRAQSGAVILTGPEVDKLRQLAERAYLYVVTFCKGDKPCLRVIQDPISKLSLEMLYRRVQFLVEEQDWSKNGAEVLVEPKN